MSQRHVASEVGALIVADAGSTLTPSGPVSALEVKGRMAAELESPAVSITGDEAVVTGRVCSRTAALRAARLSGRA